MGSDAHGLEWIHHPSQSFYRIIPWNNLFCNTVRAEIITELILERAGPDNFKTFILELKAFRLIPVIFLQEERRLKITGNDC